MPRIAADRTLILSNLGFDARGPYLEFNDVFGKTQHRMPILGRTFSLRRLPHRYCTGSFDLISYRSAACELSAELLLNPDQKDMNMCPHCQELTGFDPAFYNASTISPQQRAYNKTPHFVYMAYFSPQHLKVGISSETRGIDRLLEQGARVCAILKRFENADDARSLEADLCARADTFESMRLSAKVKLLSEYFNPHEAIESLKRRCALLGIEPEGGYLDLTPYYFGEGVACARAGARRRTRRRHRRPLHRSGRRRHRLRAERQRVRRAGEVVGILRDRDHRGGDARRIRTAADGALVSGT